jgi:hypothetical protein
MKIKRQKKMSLMIKLNEAQQSEQPYNEIIGDFQESQ